MEGRSSPGERPSPVGKPAKRALPSPGSRKLPSPVKHVNGNKEELVGKQQNDDEYDETPCNGTDDSITMSPTSPSPTSPSKAGVAYISENLIKRLSKEENLANIKSLNLALGKDLNKKFRYLENLDNLKNLSALHISNHMIEKIEKLDKLTQLRELNLSRNSITKLEGLESLVHLQVLNISRNQIQTLPAPLMKKLRELRVFHFAYNSLESLLEITKLRPLQDLTEISMVGNPMSTLAHSHLYAIFQLRSLTTLDKQTVMDDERVAADDRFGQDEIRRLEAELNRQNKLYDALFEEKHSVSTELDKVSRLHQQQKEKDTQLAQRNKELQRELNAKEEILASKTKELARACEKQFRLEQELAFYKLDAKFEHLGKLPWPEGAEFPEVEDDEAAYIGKAGFKPNAFARESHPLSPSQKAELSAIGARLSDRYGGQNKNTLDELHEALLSDLQDQEMAVKKAQLELAKLEDELRRKRNQLKDAVDELDQVQRAIEEEIQLLDDEDRRLMAAIAEKKKFIRDLEEVAADLEGRMNKIHADLRRKESEMNKLQHALNNTSPDDPAYVELQARLAETEQQLRDALSEYDSLKRDYDQAMAQLQEEIAALDKMQAELEKKRKTADKSAQQAELKSIINDLNKHLEAMKTQVAQQQEAIGQLQQEKEGLEQRLQESHDQATQGNQQLQGTQDALHREKANAETLRKRLSELEGQVAKGSSLEPLLADTKARLKSAEAEIEKLRDAIDRLKQQNQADRRAAEDRIRKEQEKTEKALQAARFGMDKERETRELGTQIDGLRSANKDLEDRIKDLEDELKRSFDKDEVFDRLADLQDDMDNNRDQIRGALGPGDELAGALGDLHKRYLDLLGALKKERQDSAADDKAKGNIRDLKALLDEAKQHEAQLEDDNSRREAELKKLGKELQKARSQLAQQGDLGKQLSHEKAAHEQEVASLEHEIAVLKDQLKLAKHAMDQALADARGPLEDRISGLEDKLDALRNKLARSKEQNKQLKAMHGDNAAEQKRLQAQVADLVDALEDAKERARRAADKRAGDKRALEGQIKDLEGGLARAQDRLDKTLDNAETQLDRERSASAARIRGLEDELDRMAEKLQKANERAYQQAANGDLARQLGNEVAALQDEVHRARLLSHKLGKADQDNAALEALLDEKNRQLQNLANRDGAQQARVSGLQDQIDELRRMFSGAQGQAMKEKVEKELEAVRAEEKRVHAQATAARDLASAQKQVAELQALLAAKDKELQGHVNKGLADEASIAPLRNEIGNLASALAAQNKELEQLKASLANGGIPLSGYADGSLAAEVEALRAALQARESQVNALLHAGTPLSPPLGHMSITGSPLLNTRVVTTPVVSPGFMESTLGTTPGEIHHHHHFKNTGRRSKSSPEIPVSPTVLGTTASAPVSPVHHHHYDGLPGERSRRKKKARKSVDDSYCNVSEHGDLEYEVGRLEGVLSATQRANTSQNQRESLRLDLQSLENEVEGAVRSRTSSRRSQVHSLDGTLATIPELPTPVPSPRLVPSTQPSQASSPNPQPCEVTRPRPLPGLVTSPQLVLSPSTARSSVDEFPAQYLVPSDPPQDVMSQQPYPGYPVPQPEMEAGREFRMNELTHLDSILRKRRMELQEVTADLAEHRHELDAVISQCKRSEERMRRAEEDAGALETRASETSSGLIRAGNQLLSLDIKTRGMTEKLTQITAEVDLKKKELLEAEQSLVKVRKDSDGVMTSVEERTRELKSLESRLADTEERLSLYLKLEDLREVVAATEREEHAKHERRVSALKDGEKIIEERTTQLARTHNELQKQTAEYHELNTCIARARKDLSELELAMATRRREIEEQGLRREKEREYHEGVLQQTADRLTEVNDARNEALEALRKHRAELMSMRERVQEESEKLSMYERETGNKEREIEGLTARVAGKEEELISLKEKTLEAGIELESVVSEINRERGLLKKTEEDRSMFESEMSELAARKQKLQDEIQELEQDQDRIKGELVSLKKQVVSACADRDRVQSDNKTSHQELDIVKQELKDQKQELESLINSKREVTADLKLEKKKFSETKQNHAEFEAEFRKLRDEIEHRRDELEQLLQKGETTRHSTPAERMRDEPAKRSAAVIGSKEVEEKRKRRRGAQLPVPKKHDVSNVANGNERISNSKKYVDEAETASEVSQQSSGTAVSSIKSSQETRTGHAQSDLEGTVDELKGQNKQMRQSLKKSLLEIKKLKEDLKKQQATAEQAQRSLKVSGAKSKEYKHKLGQTVKEHAQEQTRLAREMEFFRSEAQHHFGHAQKLARELMLYKQKHEREKNENMEDKKKNAKKDIEDQTSQIKELVKSLKLVETTRDQTLEEIEQLQRTKESMELQLEELRHSIKETSEKTLEAQKIGMEAAKQNKDDVNRKMSAEKIKLQQGQLRDQLRQQMTKRAELLEEERRKAGQSLEGLKSKLKNLEQVITRKDSTVQDFRIELAKSRLDKEKVTEMENELNELKHKLQQVQDERDMALVQRDHLATLGKETAHLRQPAARPEDTLANQDRPRTQPLTRPEVREGAEVALLLETLRRAALEHGRKPRTEGRERRGREERIYHEGRREGKRLGRVLDVRDLASEASSTMDSESEQSSVNASPFRKLHTQGNSKRSHSGESNCNSLEIGTMSSKAQSRYSVSRNNSQDSPEKEKTRRDIDKDQYRSPLSSYRPKNYKSPWRDINETGSPPPQAPMTIGKSALVGTPSRKGPDESGSVSSSQKKGRGRVDLEREKTLGFLSVSSLADDKRTRFLASVNQLKNEKMRELEKGMQHFYQQR